MSTSLNVDIQIDKENLNDKFQKVAAVITWFIIVLIPAYSVTITQSTYGPIKEKTFLWPWMILTRYSPSSEYNADQFEVAAFPWSFILFIPFMYALKASWDLYTNIEQKAIKSGYIIMASVVQLFLLMMTNGSQSSTVTETVSAYYFPQVILILFHGVIGFRWYTEELRHTQKR